MITNLKIASHGEFHFEINGMKHSANFSLYLIKKAWEAGCDFEKECDGFGPGMGTNDDWSGIRDSSDSAVEIMLEKALNFN